MTPAPALDLTTSLRGDFFLQLQTTLNSWTCSVGNSGTGCGLKDEAEMDCAACFPALLAAGLAGLDSVASESAHPCKCRNKIQLSIIKHRTLPPTPRGAFAHTTSTSYHHHCESQSEEEGTDNGCCMAHTLVLSTLVLNVQELRSEGEGQMTVASGAPLPKVSACGIHCV